MSCGLGPLGFITGGQAMAVQSVAALLLLCFCFHGCLRAEGRIERKCLGIKKVKETKGEGKATQIRHGGIEEQL